MRTFKIATVSMVKSVGWRQIAVATDHNGAPVQKPFHPISDEERQDAAIDDKNSYNLD
jgi:hypothetical protein